MLPELVLTILADYKSNTKPVLSFHMIGVSAEGKGEGERLQFLLHHSAYAPVGVHLGWNKVNSKPQSQQQSTRSTANHKPQGQHQTKHLNQHSFTQHHASDMPK